MWIHPGDQFEIENKVCEIIRIDGLYSTSSNVKVVLKNEVNKVLEFPLMDFNNKFDDGKIKAIHISPKLRQGS